MNFAIVSGETAWLCKVSFAPTGGKLEEMLNKDGDSYVLLVKFLFELNPAYRRQFVSMEDLSVPVPDLEAIMPMVREHGLALIRAYEADPRIAKGKTIVVLGYPIVVNETPYWGKGSKLDHFQRLLMFLSQAIEAREDVSIYFFEALELAERKIIRCLMAQPSGLRLHEIIQSTQLSSNDATAHLQHLQALRMVVANGNGESYSPTRKAAMAL